MISYAEPPSPLSEDTPAEEESSNSSAGVHETPANATKEQQKGTSQTNADTRQSNTPKSHKRAKSHKHKKRKKKKHELGSQSDEETDAEVGRVVAKASRMNGVVIATSCVDNGSDGLNGAESTGGADEHDNVNGAKPPLTTTIKFNVKVQNEINAKKMRSSNNKKHKRRR